MRGPSQIQPKFVLLQHKGTWRVSLKETVSATLGISAGDFAKQLAKSVRAKQRASTAASPPR